MTRKKTMPIPTVNEDYERTSLLLPADAWRDLRMIATAERLPASSIVSALLIHFAEMGVTERADIIATAEQIRSHRRSR